MEFLNAVRYILKSGVTAFILMHSSNIESSPV